MAPGGRPTRTMPVRKGSALDPAATRAKVLSTTGRLLHERGISLCDWFADHDYRGCGVMNAAAETRGQESPVRDIARAHLRRYHQVRAEDLTAAGVADPEGSARRPLPLIEGATTVTAVQGRPDAGRNARRAAEALLNAATRAQGGPADQAPPPRPAPAAPPPGPPHRARRGSGRARDHRRGALRGRRRPGPPQGARTSVALLTRAATRRSMPERPLPRRDHSCGFRDLRPLGPAARFGESRYEDARGTVRRGRCPEGTSR